MDWNTYEKQVFDELVRSFPTANLLRDTRMPGRFSKTERQIDIRIAGIAAGVYYQIIVDTKLYNRRIDVKDVEEFIGMLNDLDCNQGMLITEGGFTRRAINRATNNPLSLSIDIISYSDLMDYQTTKGAIGFTNEFAVTIRAPLGWAIDSRSEQHAYVASLYNRCYSSKEEAIKAENFMYVMIEPKSIYSHFNDLIKYQETETKARLPPGIEFEYGSWKSDSNRHYTIRQIYIPGRVAIEITAFAEFPSFYCGVVMITPFAYIKVNFPRLIYVMDGLVGMEKQKDGPPVENK